MSDHITVDLDQPRQFILDMKAAKALDRSCGEVGLFTINSKLGAFNIDTLERVLWAASLEAEPTVTLALTQKRIATYQKKHTTLAPLFIASAKLIEQSGLFNPTTEDDAEGNDLAATT